MSSPSSSLTTASATIPALTAATRFCPDGAPPPQFPGLYIPHDLDQGGLYICSTYDAWLFTTLWTLIVYAAFYLAAAGYAFLVQVGASASGSGSGSGSRSGRRDGTANGLGRVTRVSQLRTESSGSASGTVVRAGGKGNGAGMATKMGDGGGVEGLVNGARRNWRVTIVVGIAYIVVGGVEAVLAGGIVGALLGAVYDAGGFRLSTWIPLVWAVINVLFLILSSFSIQERLL